jgi:hypothetical protein
MPKSYNKVKRRGLKNIALKLPKIGTTAMSIIVENCGHFQGKSQSYITNNLLL